MSIFSLACKFIPRSLKQYIKTNLGIIDHSICLDKLKGQGFLPATILDVGANEGQFSDLAGSIFNQSKVLMIEPNDQYSKILESKALFPQFIFECSLISDSLEPLYFKKDQTNSTVVLENKSNLAATIFPKLLDGVCKERQVKGPFLLKIDVQGYELHVLRGAIQVLKETQVVILEVSLIPLHNFAPTPSDIILFFKDQGFRLFDVYGFNRRPCNKDLWQVDWVFVRNESVFGSPSLGW